MNKYPNMGLYANLNQCEDDLFELINSNFLKIDSLWMLRIISVVSELPVSSEKGDVYILNYGVYEDSFSLYIWDGFAWQHIDLKEGYWFYDISVQDFAFFNGTELEYFKIRYGDVSGPLESLNNSIAIFDGESGRFITDSGVVIEDGNNISGVNYLNTYAIYSSEITSVYGEINDLYSNNIYADSIVSDIIFSKNLSGEMTEIELINPGEVEFKSLFGYVSPALADQEIDSIVLSGIPENISYLFAIENNSGGKFTFLSGGNISLGGQARVTIEDGGSAVLIYSSVSERFLVVSGGGGKGGGSGHLDWDANDIDAPIKFIESGIEFFSYPNDDNYKINSFIKLNSGYEPEPLSIIVPCVTKGNGQFAFNLEATLIKIGGDFSGADSVIDQIVISDEALNNEYYSLPFEIIDEDGMLNGTLCEAGDIILLELTREQLVGAPNNEDEVNVFKRQSEILIGSI